MANFMVAGLYHFVFVLGFFSGRNNEKRKDDSATVLLVHLFTPAKTE